MRLFYFKWQQFSSVQQQQQQKSRRRSIEVFRRDCTSASSFSTSQSTILIPFFSPLTKSAPQNESSAAICHHSSRLTPSVCHQSSIKWREKRSRHHSTVCRVARKRSENRNNSIYRQTVLYIQMRHLFSEGRENRLQTTTGATQHTVTLQKSISAREDAARSTATNVNGTRCKRRKRRRWCGERERERERERGRKEIKADQYCSSKCKCGGLGGGFHHHDH